MRAFIKPLIAVVIVAGLLEGCYLQQGGWMMLNPKYGQGALLGLTRAQVVQRLGSPNFDPQTSATRPWNDAQDGPYYLGYYQNWATCTITFKDGKVDSVKRSWK